MASAQRDLAQATPHEAPNPWQIVSLTRGCRIANGEVKENQMSVFRRILFPVNFSVRCRSVAPFVSMMAQRYSAELTVLHVIELPVSVYTTIGHDTLLDLPAIRRAAREQIAAFVREEFEGAPVQTEVLECRAAAGIAEYVASHGTDLIMMPTHGYGPFKSGLLGSVTAKVLHDVSCPVWTDAHVEDPGIRTPEYKSMLCAVDLNTKHVPLIRNAAKLAGDFGANLRLVHAVPEAEWRPASHFDVEYRTFLFENARKELQEMQAEAGTDLEACLEGGSVAKVVRAAAEHHQADLVLIGRGASHEPLGRLRSNTYAVIRESICPVLSW
jgi:nucleotide-binding universal stress UspA family protein